MARRREVGPRSGVVADVVDHLERWCGRLDRFAASSDEWLAGMTALRRDVTRAQVARLAAGQPVVVEGWLVGRPRAGACRLSADGHVGLLEETA